MEVKTSKYKDNIKVIISILLSLIIVLIKPLGMNFNQSMVLGTLILVLIWWTTGIVNRTYASIFLLISFSLVGNTDLTSIFKFPLSSNFYVIALSFLLSQGIVNSNVANRLANSILRRYGDTPYKLIFMSFIFGTILIFLIPQAFPRAILLASIYREFFRGKNLPKKTEEVLFFSIFIAIPIVYMAFLNGDLILNYAVLQFANLSVSWAEWASYMLLPTIAATFVLFIAFILTFRRDLKDISFDFTDKDTGGSEVGSKEKPAIIIMVLVILLWMTEPLHGINSALVALVGTIAMFGFNIIDTRDFKSLNLNLLIFLTGAFAIGSVMNQSGVANIVYSKIIGIFPSTYSNLYLFVLLLTVMGLHMLLGSAVTTASVVIPILIELTRGILNPVVISLLVYMAVNIHFILPFHHTVIMVGSGNDLYSNRLVIKFGLVLTLMLFVVIFGLYIPWWKFIGLL